MTAKIKKVAEGRYTYFNWNIKKTAPGTWIFHRKTETSLHVADTRKQAVALIDKIRSETMIEKTHALTGEKFLEREDTPYYCSPSSETYFSM